MTLREPATFWTDCALAAWSAWLACAVAREVAAPLPAVVVWWIGAFATSALAATAGALHHGLGHEFSPGINRAAWRLALLALVATGLCLLQIAAHTAFTGAALAVAQWAAWLVAALLAAAAVRIEQFYVAICAYGLGQLLVLVATFATFPRHTAHHLAWLAAGVGTSVLAAGVQHFRRGLGPHFNHNDVYHVVQVVAQGCFYFTAVSSH